MGGEHDLGLMLSGKSVAVMGNKGEEDIEKNQREALNLQEEMGGFM